MLYPLSYGGSSTAGRHGECGHEASGRPAGRPTRPNGEHPMGATRREKRVVEYRNRYLGSNT